MPKEIRELRYSSYIIPVRIKDGEKQIAIIEYKPGAHGTIGGRFEDNETDAREVLRRELTEELNPGAAKMADYAMEIPEPYRFKVAPERVALRCAHNEVHNFFLAKIPADMEITFCEECPGNVHIVWYNAEALVDEKVIGFPDMREYFEINVMPIIRNM